MRPFTLVLVLVFVTIASSKAYSNGGDRHNRSVGFLQPSVQAGNAWPSNSNFPEQSVQMNYSISLGSFIYDTKKPWAVYLNFPSVGVDFSYTDYGTNVFGESITILPFICLSPSKRYFKSVHFKVGLGSSVFTEHFDQYSNPRNLSIGSTFTWTFQTTIYYNFLLGKFSDLNIGISFIHHSNGHTQLPNLGLNSFLFSLSSRLYFTPVDNLKQDKLTRPKLEKSKQLIINVRAGLGMHEFGGPGSPTGDIKRIVSTFSIGIGKIIKNVVQLDVGISYRFYDQYYHYILTYQPEEYQDAPYLNACNLMVYLGGELLLGRIGIDAMLGLNFYKPFYDMHGELYQQDDSPTVFGLKKYMATRLGMKVYLFNTEKQPKVNFYLGGDINANFGQADFSELSVGMVKRIGSRQ